MTFFLLFPYSVGMKKKKRTPVWGGGVTQTPCTDTTRLHTSLTGSNSLQLLHLGAVAQLGEHLPCTQGVVGSNPIRSIPHPGSTPPEGHDVPPDPAVQPSEPGSNCGHPWQ